MLVLMPISRIIHRASSFLHHKLIPGEWVSSLSPNNQLPNQARTTSRQQQESYRSPGDCGLGDTWHPAAGCQPVSLLGKLQDVLSSGEVFPAAGTFLVSIELVSAVAPAARSQPRSIHQEWVRDDTGVWCSLPGPDCCIQCRFAQRIYKLSK